MDRVDKNDGFTLDVFIKNIKEIKEISDRIHDNWQYHQDQNGEYLTKTIGEVLKNGEKAILVQFEYHLAFNISYGVPILCFIAWKQDGSQLRTDEYWGFNENFKNCDIFTTLTQLDHPVLCKPFLTLHPCRTHEIIQPFLGKSKNLVISWMTVVFPFLNIPLDSEYLKFC